MTIILAHIGIFFQIKYYYLNYKNTSPFSDPRAKNLPDGDTYKVINFEGKSIYS
jgi:hypothetical protein